MIDAMASGVCELCGRELVPAGHYVVRIDVFADPAMPGTSTQDLQSIDFDAALDKLLDEMKDMTLDELQDQVHRRFEYRICPKCQQWFLRDPLRGMRSGD